MSGSSERKVLVVYYSVTGNTARVARDVARLTGADIETIRDANHGVGFVGYLKCVIDAVRGASANIAEPVRNPRNYALTIVGTPVWAWNMTPAVRTYLQQCQAQFGDVAFFVTSGDTDAAKIVPAMELAAGHKAIASAGFNARVLANREKYEAGLATFVKSLNASQPPTVASVGGPVHAR